MLDLIPFLLSRLGMLALLAFLLSQWRTSRHVFKTSTSRSRRLALLSMFVVSGILMNYAGVAVSSNQTIDPLLGLAVTDDQLLIDTRLTIIVTSGLLGGPFVGGLTGLLVGFHRFLLGSMGAETGWFIAVVAGTLSGLYSRRWRLKDKYTLLQPLALVMSMVILDLGLAILLADDPSELIVIASQAVFPMLFANTIGIIVFIVILRTQLRFEKELFVRESARSSRLLAVIRPLRKEGMTTDVACQIGTTILEETKIDRVVLLGPAEVLVDIEAGETPVYGGRFQPNVQRWIEEAVPLQVEDRTTNQILSFHPLQMDGDKAGIVCYFPSHLFDDTIEQTTEQLVQLFARELVTYREEQLEKRSLPKMKPFLHPNYLRGIVDEIHQTADPGTPVKQQLGSLLQLLTAARWVEDHPLRDEITTLKAYLALEGTRRRQNQLTHADITIDLDVETAIEETLIMPFLLTKLVDNALRHAFSKAGRRSQINVRAFRQENDLVLEVSDNGVGIGPDVKRRLEEDALTETSTLFLLRRTLDIKYGKAATCTIHSRLNQGTRVVLTLPLPVVEEG